MELASSAWAHPYSTLEEITQFAAAFLDLLQLASGLQSSARPFAWPPSLLHKALAWARHLEKVVADFPASGEGLESRRALDDALANLIASAPTYPAGLPCLTASDLSSARRLFLQALLQAVSPDSDYFESVTGCLIRLEGESASVKEEISARNYALRCAESLKQFVESAAGSLLLEKEKITGVATFWDCGNSTVEMTNEKHFEAWARNAMEYVTSFTTVYKSAAASLIFKASEDDWRRVLDTSQAYTSRTMGGESVGNEAEIVVSSSIARSLRLLVDKELCCLQLAYSDCRDLAFRIAASPLITSTEVCDTGNRLGGWPMPEGAISIETFLGEILENQIDLWWALPPVLLAGVCRSRFSMLETYLQTLMKGAKVEGSSCKCTCHVSGKPCLTCLQCSNALVERLWCFAVHHPELRTFQALHVDSVCEYLRDEAQKKVVS